MLFTKSLKICKRKLCSRPRQIRGWLLFAFIFAAVPAASETFTKEEVIELINRKLILANPAPHWTAFHYNVDRLDRFGRLRLRPMDNPYDDSSMAYNEMNLRQYDRYEIAPSRQRGFFRLKLKCLPSTNCVIVQWGPGSFNNRRKVEDDTLDFDFRSKEDARQVGEAFDYLAKPFKSQKDLF